MISRVSMIRLSQARYDALAEKDADALYFTDDTCRIYRGTNCYSLEKNPIFDPGGAQPGQVLIKTAEGYGWAWASQFQKPYELVLYLPLSAETMTADTGQSITPTGTQGFVFDDVLQRQCLQLNGNGYLTVSPIGLPFEMYPRTLSVWAKSDEAATVNKCIFSYGTNGSNRCFGLSFQPNNVVGIVGGGGVDFQTITEENALDQTVWNHFCATYDGVVEKLYVNGILAVSATIKRSTGTMYARVGTWVTGNTPSDNFVGRISDLRLYDGVLSEEEIATLSTP